MPARPTREERRAETRRRLLDGASTVFAQRGYHGATLDEIAEEAGYTKGAVYSNFDGKEDLFLNLLEEHIQDRIEEVRAAFDGIEVLDDVREGGRMLAEQVAGDRDLWFLFFEFWGYAARDDVLRGRLSRLYRLWRAEVGDIVARQFRRLGLELPAPAEDVAASAIAMAEGLALQRLIDPDLATPAHYGDAFAFLAAGTAVTGLGLDLDVLRAETGS